jgi:hypothetical protein
MRITPLLALASVISAQTTGKDATGKDTVTTTRKAYFCGLAYAQAQGLSAAGRTADANVIRLTAVNAGCGEILTIIGLDPKDQ